MATSKVQSRSAEAIVAPVVEAPTPEIEEKTTAVAEENTPTEVQEDAAVKETTASAEPDTNATTPETETETEAEAVTVEEPVAAPAPKKEKITLPSGKKIVKDDLKIVEGIGPKIEGLLNDAGIFTWNDLANAATEKVQAILDDAGSRYRMHNPATWAKQAELADTEQWEALEEYQDHLQGGVDPDAK